MRVASLTVGPFEENCYIVSDPATGSAAVIDPGDEGDSIVALIRKAHLSPQAIWLTHAHLDHIGGIAAVKSVWNVPVFLHPLDRPLYDRGADQAAFYGIPFDQPPPPEREWADGDVAKVGSLSFDVMHLPGHAPGHVAFHGNGHLFGGDVLFAGSIGRTDLPLADPAAMSRSLERLLTLPDATIVHPGHGPLTSIEEERRNNPFLLGLAHA